MTTAISRIESLLHDTMGLDVASIGAASVERAIRSRMVVCRISTFGEYWMLLKESQRELQALIDAVVVPETWFSRDAQAFAELGRVAREEWRPTRPGALRRLLCMPCSTGEESYSMAMAMLDAGYSRERFVIDAVDICERSLEKARRGIYGRNSFRGQDLAFRDHYFEPVADGHRVNDSVRRGVRFRHGNVLDENFLGDEARYDAIFCRNLLIYFDKATQERTVAKLKRLLADDGVLFIGPAEANMVHDQGFVSAKVPFAFAFRKSSHVPAKPAPRVLPPNVSPLPLPEPAADSRSAASLRAMTLAMEQLQNTPLLPSGSPDLMKEAVALADQGRLVEAEILCEEQIREHGPTASLFHLMGLICSASGRTGAADRYYRKALYLDQGHHGALMHLSLLLEQQGDERGAQLLRSRAQRR